jgi:hypothetical protein
LLSGVPPGDILQVTGNPADLDNVMGAAFRADCLVAEWAEPDPGNHLMGAVAVVERAHNGKVGFPAVRAGGRVNDKVAGMALVFALFFWNIFNPFIFF